MTKAQLRSAPFALVAVLLAAPAAYAQMAGTYTGTNNEGQAVQVVVQDNGGVFQITGISDGGTVFCKKSGKSDGYGVGFGGVLTNITNGKATYTDLAINVYLKAFFDFKGTTVKGNMIFSVPILEAPNKAEGCSTKPQTFTATLGGADAAFPIHGALAWPLRLK